MDAYGRSVKLVNGVYKPAYTWGAPPCRVFMLFFPLLVLLAKLQTYIVMAIHEEVS